MLCALNLKPDILKRLEARGPNTPDVLGLNREPFTERDSVLSFTCRMCKRVELKRLGMRYHPVVVEGNLLASAEPVTSALADARQMPVSACLLPPHPPLSLFILLDVFQA